MDEPNWDCFLPTDVLVEILLLLPPCSLRRFRLVSRLWRNLIDAHTTKTRTRAKTLLVVTSSTDPAAAFVVVDDLSPGNSRELWSNGGTKDVDRYKGMSVVGTCNGLICLCDNSEPGGAITLVNPLTGEALAVPPLPCPRASTFGRRRERSWHETYSFAYHWPTGLYKVVHVPCYFDRIWDPADTAHVLTLGEASWRDVPLPAGPGAARCRLGTRLLSVNCVTYWITENTDKVMSLDLGDERVACVDTVPVSATPGSCLTEVDGRLGIAIRHDWPMTNEKIVEVWVLEAGREKEQQGWSRRYSVRMNRRMQEVAWLKRQLALPYSADGEHVLTHGCGWSDHRVTVLYKHRLSRVAPNPIVIQTNPGVEVARITGRRVYGAFAYVETTEPLRGFPTRRR